MIDAERPVVSVLLTTYNHEKLIGDALRGVLEQKTDYPFEVIVGVDASDDATAEVVRSFERESGGRLRAIVHARRVGLMENLRAVFAAPRGRYLSLLDGDDYWCHPHKLQRQIDLLESHADTALCGHFVEQRTLAGEALGTIPERAYPETSDGVAFVERLCDLHLSSLFFRQVFPGGLPDALLDPRARVPDLGIKLVLAGHGGVAFLPERWSVFRRVPGSVSWELSYRSPEWRLAIARGLRNARRFLPARLKPTVDRLRADQFLAAAAAEDRPVPRLARRARALTLAPVHSCRELAKLAYGRLPEPARQAYRSARAVARAGDRPRPGE